MPAPDRRRPTPREDPPRRSVEDWQRARIMRAASLVAEQHDYREATVARIVSRAGISRRTFYELFADRDACFAAILDGIVAVARRELRAAVDPHACWLEQVRAATGTLLALLDGDRGAARICTEHAASAGGGLRSARDGALAELARAAASTSAGERAPAVCALATELAVWGAAEQLRLALAAGRPRSLTALQPTLLAPIVLPRLGADAAQRELERAVPASGSRERRRPGAASDVFALPRIRMTRRTVEVLRAAGEHPGASGRELADAAGINDQGQISKLLARLEASGLVAQDGAGRPKWSAKAWCLTAHGRAVLDSIGEPPAFV